MAFQFNCQPFELTCLLICQTVKKWNLMEKAVCFRRSPQPCHSGLIWNGGEEYIKVVLKVFHMLRVHAS